MGDFLCLIAWSPNGIGFSCARAGQGALEHERRHNSQVPLFAARVGGRPLHRRYAFTWKAGVDSLAAGRTYMDTQQVPLGNTGSAPVLSRGLYRSTPTSFNVVSSERIAPTTC